MNKVNAIWELMRLEHGVMLAIAIFIGSLIGLQSQGNLSFQNFPISNFILTFFTALFLEASTFALNDYYDIDIDKENKRRYRPLARGDLQPKTALYLFYLLFPLGLLCSFFVNLICFIIAFITAFFAILYDVYLKKIKLLGNFYIAYVMAIPFVFGAAAIINTNFLITPIDPAVLIVAMIAFLTGSGREIMKDVMDFEGDTTSGVKSFPKYIGVKKSNAVSSIFYLIAVCFSIFPFLINTKIDMPYYRKLTLFGLFLGLLAFFVAAFIG
jgi:geranylgeranylglycerol-phosphate geranylgeranyltransferase